MSTMIWDDLQRLKTALLRWSADHGEAELPDYVQQALEAMSDTIAEAWPPQVEQVTKTSLPSVIAAGEFIMSPKIVTAKIIAEQCINSYADDMGKLVRLERAMKRRMTAFAMAGPLAIGGE